MERRRILITDEDMASLRELVRHSRKTSHRDHGHLDELHRELDRAEVVASGEVPPDVALIGYRAGDVVQWAAPGGTRRLRIERVLFQPERKDAVA
jgi:regulator of nucleoside diphosphate kinase